MGTGPVGRIEMRQTVRQTLHKQTDRHSTNRQTDRQTRHKHTMSDVANEIYEMRADYSIHYTYSMETALLERRATTDCTGEKID